jgi:hypothetical protein
MRISKSVLAAAVAGACMLGFGTVQITGSSISAASISGDSISGDGIVGLPRIPGPQPGVSGQARVRSELPGQRGGQRSGDRHH